MNTSRLFIFFVFCFLGTLSRTDAAQVPVTLTIDDILSADNPYTLTIGDTFEWQVEYDPTKIITSEGEQWLYPALDPTLQINGIIGTFSFDIGDTIFAPLPLAPALHFTDNILDAFFMLFVIDSPYQNMMGGDQYQCIDLTDDDIIYAGTFTFPGTVVPLPGAVWMLGSAFAGLVTFRRKNK